jgi:ABC-type lipoprotein export system ATPase subunit
VTALGKRKSTGSAQPGEEIIRIVDLHKTYHMGEIKVRALRGIDLVLIRGAFLIITGRNGSGKSTLLHQLGLLDRPDQGEIWLDGREVTHMAEKERSELRLRGLGYVFQEFALIPELTALENVMLPAMMLEKKSACRRRAMELLARVGLEEQVGHLPRQLSGGEQQKTAIARALINDPMVVFADEPTANLDTISASEVLGLLNELNRQEGHTIIMVTHEAEEASYGNILITLSDGCQA